MLYRLIYVSDARGAAGANLFVLADILGASERNNRRDRLSGVLVQHDGRFLQQLEGARVDLDRLMGRLRVDPRHGDIRVLHDAPIAARTMHWPMAHPPLTPALKAFMIAPDPAIGAARVPEMLREAAAALPAAA
ncbi:BLUF domain-containing protein [Brevundimonas sp. Leaf363]|uniref:BLUF domain-containing protein n=1 Tax=Brevundimonas sp. Leaf363 TaxID=1736353 RepID=UPI0009E7B7F1|nr:BLUF domain-containing protein [Brevundimonas sp. Leaf363]